MKSPDIFRNLAELEAERLGMKVVESTEKHCIVQNERYRLRINGPDSICRLTQQKSKEVQHHVIKDTIHLNYLLKFLAYANKPNPDI